MKKIFKGKFLWFSIILILAEVTANQFNDDVFMILLILSIGWFLGNFIYKFKSK